MEKKLRGKKVAILVADGFEALQRSLDEWLQKSSPAFPATTLGL